MDITYKEDLEIDKFGLEDEWLRQPQLYMKWSGNYAQAILERDRIWQRRKVIRAELDAEIRLRLEEEGKKSTDTIIDSLIRTSEKHKKASEKLIEANKNVNILESAKWAMEHKKKALEDLVKLHLSGYYAEPDIPQEAKEKAGAQTSQGIKERLRTSKRLKERKDG